MTSVTSKVFAITGGASGIGAASSRLLAKRGASVICVGDISNNHFEELRRDIGRINNTTKVTCTVLDVTSSDQVEGWISDIISTYGDLHGAANIAGIAQGADLRTSPTILEETDDEWSKIIKVSLDGVFYCTRAEIRAMKNLETTGRSIVNVGSIAAFSHQPDVYAYGTSKAACAYLSTCAAADVFPLRIRVNTVSPGK
jgi:chanoclavine-I dehydrogenase